MMTTGRGRSDARARGASERARRGAKGVAMFWKQVTKAAMTAGTAEGGPPLNAFAKPPPPPATAKRNLIKVSRIGPGGVEIVGVPRIKPGALVPTAYAAITSATPGQIIAAAVGYALPVDRTKAGVIMEFPDLTDRGTAEP